MVVTRVGAATKMAAESLNQGGDGSVARLVYLIFNELKSAFIIVVTLIFITLKGFF